MAGAVAQARWDGGGASRGRGQGGAVGTLVLVRYAEPTWAGAGSRHGRQLSPSHSQLICIRIRILDAFALHAMHHALAATY
jgi:hypothetical protein